MNYEDNPNVHGNDVPVMSFEARGLWKINMNNLCGKVRYCFYDQLGFHFSRALNFYFFYFWRNAKVSWCACVMDDSGLWRIFKTNRLGVNPHPFERGHFGIYLNRLDPGVTPSNSVSGTDPICLSTRFYILKSIGYSFRCFDNEIDENGSRRCYFPCDRVDKSLNM